MSFQVGELFARLSLESTAFDDGIKKGESGLTKMGGMFAKIGIGAGIAMGTAGLAVAGLATTLTDDLTKSLNGVQASTGVADDMMGDMRTTMLDIYNDNFGENFEEIGASMTTISQQTGLAGEQLKKVTEGALAVKDTFGMEVAESVRGANQLMKQFGLDGEASYNLIAQGAQWGLDANGDLIDTLNEYSGTFAAQGFSAEEMFNMLSNGAAAGVRDTDLLADAIKEFGIRSKDGSKASGEGFAALGLDAAKMTAAFAQGGAVGKAAFEKTTQALVAMKDPVAQNAAGVALFGTQFEDLGIKGITALVNMNGEISQSVNALGKINEVKYNSFSEGMEGIKRNLQTGLLIPLGEQILPKLNEFANWIRANMPEIKAGIGAAMEKAVIVFKAVSDFISIQLVPRFKEIVSVVGEIAQKYFPAMGDSSGGLGAALGTLVKLGLDVLTVALKFVRDNSGLVKFAIEALIVAMISWKAYTIATTIATNAMTFAVNAQKAATVVSTAMTWLWNAALLANPVGLVVLAIVGLIGILITVTGKWDAVTNAVKKAWEWLKSWNNTAVKDKSTTVTTWHTDRNTSGEGPNQRIGGNAKGTDNWRGGLTWVGEEGPELVNLPKGAQVIPNDKAMGGGQSTVNLTVEVAQLHVREEADINRVSQQLYDLQSRKLRGQGVRA